MPIQLPGIPNRPQPTKETFDVDPRSAAAPGMAIATDLAGSVGEVGDHLKSVALQIAEVENWKSVAEARGKMRNGFKQWTNDVAEQGLAPHELRDSWAERSSELKGDIFGVEMTDAARDRLEPEWGEWDQARHIDVAEQQIMQSLTDSQNFYGAQREQLWKDEDVEGLRELDRTTPDAVVSKAQKKQNDYVYDNLEEDLAETASFDAELSDNPGEAFAKYRGDVPDMDPETQRKRRDLAYREMINVTGQVTKDADELIATKDGNVTREEVEQYAKDASEQHGVPLGTGWVNDRLSYARSMTDAAMIAAINDPAYQRKIYDDFNVALESYDPNPEDPRELSAQYTNMLGMLNKVPAGNLRTYMKSKIDGLHDAANGVRDMEQKSSLDVGREFINSHFEDIKGTRVPASVGLTDYAQRGRFLEQIPSLRGLGWGEDAAKELAKLAKEGKHSEALVKIRSEWDSVRHQSVVSDPDGHVWMRFFDAVTRGDSSFQPVDPMAARGKFLQERRNANGAWFEYMQDEGKEADANTRNAKLADILNIAESGVDVGGTSDEYGDFEIGGPEAGYLNGSILPDLPE